MRACLVGVANILEALWKKLEPMESEDEKWARLDKRIERARARHELARLVMGTSFLIAVFL